MRHLALLIAGIIPVFGGLIVLAMIGGGRLHPDWTPYFDHVELCDKRFCAFGIVPGVTTWSQAETMLNIQLSDIVNSNLIYTGLSDRVDRTIFLARGYKNDPSTPVVEMLFWMTPSTSSKSLTVGAFIARFGPPCFVYYTDFGWPLFTLYYPFGVVSTQSP